MNEILSKDYLNVMDAYTIAYGSILELENYSGKLSEVGKQIALIHNSHTLLHDTQIRLFDDYDKFKEDYLALLCSMLKLSNKNNSNEEIVNFVLEELKIAKDIQESVRQGIISIPKLYAFYYDYELTEEDCNGDKGSNFADGWCKMFFRVSELLVNKIGIIAIF